MSPVRQLFTLVLYCGLAVLAVAILVGLVRAAREWRAGRRVARRNREADARRERFRSVPFPDEAGGAAPPDWHWPREKRGGNGAA